MLLKILFIIILIILLPSCLLTKSVRYPNKVDLKSIHSDKSEYSLVVIYDGSPSPLYTKYRIEKKENDQWVALFKDKDITDTLRMVIPIDKPGIYKCILTTIIDGKDPLPRESDPIELKRPGRTYVSFKIDNQLDFAKLIVVYSLPNNLQGESKDKIETRLSYFKQIVRDSFIPISKNVVLMSSDEWKDLSGNWDAAVCSWFGIKAENNIDHYETIYDATTVAFVNIRHEPNENPVILVKMHGLIYKCQTSWHERPLIYERSAEIDLCSLDSNNLERIPDRVITREIAGALEIALKDLAESSRVKDYVTLIKEHDNDKERDGAQYRLLIPEILSKVIVLEEEKSVDGKAVLEKLFISS